MPHKNTGTYLGLGPPPILVAPLLLLGLGVPHTLPATATGLVDHTQRARLGSCSGPPDRAVVVVVVVVSRPCMGFAIKTILLRYDNKNNTVIILILMLILRLLK